MTNFRFNQLLLLLLPLCLTVTTTEAKMRGERDGGPFEKQRALLDNDALRHSLGALGTQRAAYQATPFVNELNVPGLSGRQFRKAKKGAAAAEEITADATETEPMLDITMASSTVKANSKGRMMMNSGKGKGGKGGSSGSKGKSKGSSSSSSSSKSKSKSSSKSKGKGKGNSKSNGMSAKSNGGDTHHPTLSPTSSPVTVVPTITPPLTDAPTCAPITGVFPQDVSGFFQAQSGDSSELQKELDNTLTEIQVPSEFQEQCIER